MRAHARSATAHNAHACASAVAGAWPADPFAAVALAAAGEEAALAAVKRLRFREGLDWAAAAAALGVEETRVRPLRLVALVLR
jgi:hypothetical protein